MRYILIVMAGICCALFMLAARADEIAHLVEMRPGVCVYQIGAVIFEMPPRPNKSCAFAVRVRQA